MLSIMDMREYREHLERIESERRKCAEETDRFLAVLMEQPDEYAESISAVSALKGILDSLAFLRIEWCIQHELWAEMNRELSDARKLLEEVNQIEIRQESVRNLDAFSAWNKQKEWYLISAEACCREIESYVSSRYSYSAGGSGPSAHLSTAPKAKSGKRSSWWKRLFKWKAPAIEPESPCAEVPRDDAPGISDPRLEDGDFRPHTQMISAPVSPTATDHGTIPQSEARPVILDQVFFTAVAPKEFRRDEHTDVTVVMYEDAYREILDRIRENYDDDIAIRGSGAKPIAKQTTVRVTIESPEAGICFDNAEESGTWIGEYLEFHFWVLVPKDFQKKQFKLTIRVYADDVLSTTLTLFVKCNAASTQEITPERRDIRSAFVSYAREDTEEVTTLIRGMEKVRPDLNVFMDQESLRSGQNWQEVLKAEIEQRDMLFLCWSPDAKASEWVDFEWRHMYNKRGIEHIDPVPLISPQSCPPPEELAMLHFDDRWLHYRKRKHAAQDGEKETF